MFKIFKNTQITSLSHQYFIILHNLNIVNEYLNIYNAFTLKKERKYIIKLKFAI